MLRGKSKDIGNDAQRRSRRVDIGIADHELLEDIVLDRAGELSRRHPLLLGGDDKERQHRQHGAVHGHRHRHLIERNAGEQRAHVVDRVDRDARHADVAADARMVAVIAAVGRQVEGDRQALLSGRQVAPVEGVGILRGGEARILPHRPRLGHIHGRVGSAQIGRDARIAVEEIEPRKIVRPVDRFDRDALGREPWLGYGGRGHGRHIRERDGGKIWDRSHGTLDRSSVNRRCRLYAAAHKRLSVIEV